MEFDWMCRDCHEQEKKNRIQERLNARLEYFNELCPKIFQSTDLSKLPNQKAYESALATSKSLLLHGSTGRGKSRAGWEIIRIAIMAGTPVKILDSTAGIRFASKYSDSSGSVESWLDDLCNVELLFMDDVFKNKMTDAFEGFIYSIIDQRMNNERRLIATCNDTGETLGNRLTADRAEPFVRRLREFCMPIQF